MIKLNSIDKYYNKNKSNEIHVVNNTSLELPDKGMVALLGKSGSGKTTLLNIIGGLDSYDSGAIQIDESLINKYSPSLWDSIRSKKIGYVFQNYNLIDTMSVYDNLELSLKLAGLNDSLEIEKRIDYALSLVNMSKYKRRKPNTLSGGQQQRVGIARAFVKGPSIIIADEPTGNLDSDNTFEVLDILKSLSRDYLVVLVTHEEDIANFFADRIIRLKDGKITQDSPNSSSDGLNLTNNKNIYLKDLEYSNTISDKNINIKDNGDKNTSYNLHLIEKDGKLYINAKGCDYDIILIDDKSELKVIDDSYREMVKGEHQSKKVDINILSPICSTKRFNYKDIIKSFRKGLQAYRSIPKKRRETTKSLLFLFSLVVVICIFLISSYSIFNDDRYPANKNVIIISVTDRTLSEMKALENRSYIDKVLLANGRFQFKDLDYDLSIYTDSLDIYPVSLGKNTHKAIYGSVNFQHDTDIVIDIRFANQVFKGLEREGITNLNSIIGEEIVFMTTTFNIIGIIDSGFMGAFIQDQIYEMVCEGYADHCMGYYRILFNDKTKIGNLGYYGHYIQDEYQQQLDVIESIKIESMTFL